MYIGEVFLPVQGYQQVNVDMISTLIEIVDEIKPCENASTASSK